MVHFPFFFLTKMSEYGNITDYYFSSTEVCLPYKKTYENLFWGEESKKKPKMCMLRNNR